MFEGWISRALDRELARRAQLQGRGGDLLPPGYHPMHVIRGAMLSWVQVPYAGVPVWCNLRTLNRTQQEACGALTLIDLRMEDGAQPTREDLLRMRNTQEAMAKEVLNRPRFEEIDAMLIGNDFVLADKRRELDEIKALDLSSCTEAERSDIEARIYKLELYLAYILPEDTMDFLTRWALGVDVSDIKKLGYDQLLAAAIRADRNHNAPHDNISGTFTEFDSTDIDDTAWHCLAMERQERSSSGGGMRWAFGGGK